MKTFNDEDFLLENYRMMSASRIVYVGNYFRCHRIQRLTRWFIYKNSWINNSSEKDPPPDFYNEKHHLMMEVMRIDDGVNKLKGKKVANSFEKENACLVKYFGNDYRTIRDDLSAYVSTDTSDNKIFNFNGYRKCFERVVLKHSKKVPLYRTNHPKKDLIFFISDESNCYAQVINKEESRSKGKNDDHSKYAILHGWYKDQYFIDIIKVSRADYVIWACWYKEFTKGKRIIKTPLVCIYDVKNIKNYGITYKHDLMVKV